MSVSQVAYSGADDGLAPKAHAGCFPSSKIDRRKVEQPMWVWDTRLIVPKSTNGGKLGSITLAVDVIEEPRSRGGGSEMLSGEC